MADFAATFHRLHQDDWFVMVTCMPGSAAERMSCPAFGEAYVNHVYACVKHSCTLVDNAAQSLCICITCRTIGMLYITRTNLYYLSTCFSPSSNMHYFFPLSA